MRPRPILILLLAFLLIGAAQSQKDPGAPDRDRSTRIPIEGAKIFQYHCAACHGTDARGHGPASLALKHTVPDLTLISQRNGGRFPRQHVMEIIAGKAPAVRPKANQEMPVWGPIFHEVEADQDWGEVRLVAVTKHLESLQQK